MTSIVADKAKLGTLTRTPLEGIWNRNKDESDTSFPYEGSPKTVIKVNRLTTLTVTSNLVNTPEVYPLKTLFVRAAAEHGKLTHLDESSKEDKKYAGEHM